MDLVETQILSLRKVQACVRRYIARCELPRLKAKALEEAKETAWYLLWHGCPSDYAVLRSQLASELQQKKIDYRRARQQTDADRAADERARLEMELGVATFRTRYEEDHKRKQRAVYKRGSLSKDQDALVEPIVDSFRIKEKDACRQLKTYFYHLMEGAYACNTKSIARRLENELGRPLLFAESATLQALVLRNLDKDIWCRRLDKNAPEDEDIYIYSNEEPSTKPSGGFAFNTSLFAMSKAKGIARTFRQDQRGRLLLRAVENFRKDAVTANDLGVQLVAFNRMRAEEAAAMVAVPEELQPQKQRKIKKEESSNQDKRRDSQPRQTQKPERARSATLPAPAVTCWSLGEQTTLMVGRDRSSNSYGDPHTGGGASKISDAVSFPVTLLNPRPTGPSPPHAPSPVRNAWSSSPQHRRHIAVAIALNATRPPPSYDESYEESYREPQEPEREQQQGGQQGGQRGGRGGDGRASNQHPHPTGAVEPRRTSFGLGSSQAHIVRQHVSKHAMGENARSNQASKVSREDRGSKGSISSNSSSQTSVQTQSKETDVDANSIQTTSIVSGSGVDSDDRSGVVGSRASTGMPAVPAVAFLGGSSTFNSAAPHESDPLAHALLPPSLTVTVPRTSHSISLAGASATPTCRSDRRVHSEAAGASMLTGAEMKRWAEVYTTERKVAVDPVAYPHLAPKSMESLGGLEMELATDCECSDHSLYAKQRPLHILQGSTMTLKKANQFTSHRSSVHGWDKSTKQAAKFAAMQLLAEARIPRSRAGTGKAFIRNGEIVTGGAPVRKFATKRRIGRRCKLKSELVSSRGSGAGV